MCSITHTYAHCALVYTHCLLKLQMALVQVIDSNTCLAAHNALVYKLRASNDTITNIYPAISNSNTGVSTRQASPC